MEQEIKLRDTALFQLIMDGVRVGLFVVAIMILITLLSEIESVKLLHYNPCLICENKTGAICIIDRDPTTGDKHTRIDINLSELNNVFNVT